ncbi:unnamed protein product, partial [Cuscuta epithymum]
MPRFLMRICYNTHFMAWDLGNESLVGPLTLFPEGLTFDKLCTKLVHQEAHLQYQQSLESTVGVPAFSANTAAGAAPAASNAAGQQQPHRGGRGGHRGGRGRGRYQQQQLSYGQQAQAYGQQPQYYVPRP